MSVIEELNLLVKKINQNPVHIQEEKDRVFQVDLETSGTHQLILEGTAVRAEEN